VERRDEPLQPAPSPDGFVVMYIEIAPPASEKTRKHHRCQPRRLGSDDLLRRVLVQVSALVDAHASVLGLERRRHMDANLMTRSRNSRRDLVAPVTDWHYYDSKWAILMGLPSRMPRLTTARRWSSMRRSLRQLMVASAPTTTTYIHRMSSLP